MNKFIRYYNQNRREIWSVAIIIIFVIIIIQFFNSFYADLKKEEQKTNEEQEANLEQESTIEDVEEKNESMVQGSIDSYEKKEEYTKLIEQFLEYCSNNQPQKAYNLLSNNCKEKLYPTQSVFETEYYNQKFTQDKTYDFQLWSAIDKTYIYLVKIYDNMLSSGIVSAENYIQDYYSVIKEDNVYRLSINNYVKNVNYESEDDNYDINSQLDNISITVLEKDCYMDYEIYNISVVNNSKQDILLDTTLDDYNIVVLDENGNEFKAMLIELNEDDLIVKKQSSESINIKFARSYISNISAERIKFKKIVKDYTQYIQNKDDYKDYVEINVDLK